MRGGGRVGGAGGADVLYLFCPACGKYVIIAALVLAVIVIGIAFDAIDRKTTWYIPPSN